MYIINGFDSKNIEIQYLRNAKVEINKSTLKTKTLSSPEVTVAISQPCAKDKIR